MPLWTDIDYGTQAILPAGFDPSTSLDPGRWVPMDMDSFESMTSAQQRDVLSKRGAIVGENARRWQAGQTPDYRVGEDQGWINWSLRNPGKTKDDYTNFVREQNAESYDAFQAAFQMTYGRQATQTELNNTEEDDFPLNKLLKDRPHLTEKLPLERQMALPSDLIAQMKNESVQQLVEHNPQVAGGFPTKFWQRFSNDWLAKVVGPFFQANNPAEWTNIVNQNQIGGANAGALPAELRPPVADIRSPWGEPGTPPPQEAPPGGVSGPPPPAAAPPYAGPGQFGIPRAQAPTLPSDIASRSALEQYYAMLGYGNVARPPAAAATAPPLLPRTAPTTPITTSTLPPPQAPPAGGGQGALGADTAAFPDFATWRAQNPGKTYDDYFAARSAVVPPSGRTGTLAGGGEYLVDENGQVIVDENGEPIPYSPEFGPEPTTPGTTPGGGGSKPPTTSPGAGRQWVPRVDIWGNTSWVSEEIGQAGAGAQTPGAVTIFNSPLGQEKASAQVDKLNAEIEALTQKMRLDQQKYEAAIAKQDQANIIALRELIRQETNDANALSLQRDSLVQRQAEFGAELTQRQAEFGATATGMIGEQPTLQREVAISQADLANKRQQAENAVNAANIALKQGDQTEAKRQFDIAQGLRAEIERGQLGLAGRAQTESELQGAANRATQAGQLALAQGNATEAKRQFDVAQDLTERIQTGQLGLAGRAQTEAERAGEFGRGLQGAQFQFQVQRDPASFLQKAYAARGVPPPAAAVSQGAPPTEVIRNEPLVLGTTPAAPGTARLSAATSAPLATTQAPLTAGEIAANVGPGLARTLRGETPGQFFSEIPRLSAQRLNQLMPSEREEYRAAALASGTSPQDLEEEIRRRSQTGTPPPAVATRTRAAPRARLF